MPDYRRARHPGGTYFFTVNALQRQGNDLLTRHIGLLRKVVGQVRRAHPFVIHGWVVLPDHLHCVIELLPGDLDFALRLRLIKRGILQTAACHRVAFGRARCAWGTRRVATEILGASDPR